MTPEHIHQKIRRQGAEAHSNMLRATGLSKVKVERWIERPDLEPMDEEQLDLLAGWAKGEFGHRSDREGYIRIRHNTGPARCLGFSLPPVKGSGVKYKRPGEGNNVPAGVRIARPSRRGADLPTPDEAKLEAVKRREASAQAEKPKRNRVVEVMRHPWSK